MITHFADLRLNTVSLHGVRQFYSELLEIPVSFESDSEIRFQVTEFVSLTFVEAFEPVSPAHFAFEVPYSAFSSVVTFLKEEARIPLLRWPDGREIDDFTFAVGGTAYAVLASKRRRWIPVQMIALPPSMTVSFGVSGRHSLQRIRERLGGEPIVSSDEAEFTISRCGYRIRFVATDFSPDIPARLGLPLSLE